MLKRRIILAVALSVGGQAVAQEVDKTPEPAALSSPSVQAQSDLAARPSLPLGLDLYIPIPQDNPLSVEKVELGRRIFFDPILSRDYSISCATCHDPRRSFSDGLPVAVGIKGREGERNVPALLNRAWGESFSWDGRAASLEDQVLMPIENPSEFDMTIEEVLQRLRNHADYPDLFKSAFEYEVTQEDLGRAIASYVRTIFSGDSLIDRYMRGDYDVMSVEALAGLSLFRGKANCTSCHIGPTFSDEQFHNTGVAFKNGGLVDEGRFAVTGEEEHRGAFKTPSLRHVGKTAPYMHDGSLKTLEEVVALYDRGGDHNPHLDEELRPLHLTVGERQALVTFLFTLTGTVQEGVIP